MQIKRKRFDDLRKLFQKIGYQPIKSIGKGGFGEVFLAKNRSTGAKYAIKVMNRTKKKAYMEKYMTQQAQIMKRLNHPNIIKLIQFMQTPEFYMIIMEYCEQGNLLSYQANLPGRVFELNHAIQIMVEIMKGLKWIHESTYVHRDIKSENILLKKQYINGGYAIKCKIADFGLARPISKGNDAKTFCGTQKYMAPEILNNKQYGISIDLWSLAVLFYFMLFGDYPFKGLDTNSDIVRKCTPSFDLQKVVSKKERLRDIPPQVYDFFKQIFVVDFRKRITFSKIIKHPLFAPYCKQFQENETFYKNFQKNQKFKKQQQCHKITEQDQANEMQPQDESRICLQRKQQIPVNLKFISHQLEQINFQVQKCQYLAQCAEQMYTNYSSKLTYGQRLIAKFYLLRCFLFFSQPLIHSLQAKRIPQAMAQLKINHIVWAECTQTQQYRKMLKKLQQKSLKYQFLYEDTFHLIQANIKKVPINGLQNSIKYQITQKDFMDFKINYRLVTSHLFKVFCNGMGSHLQKKIQLRIFCCHSINKIFSRIDIKKKFPFYFDWIQKKKIVLTHSFDMGYFKQWIMEEDEKRLGQNLKLLYNSFY